jgi:hypothetical protein
LRDSREYLRIGARPSAVRTPAGAVLSTNEITGGLTVRVTMPQLLLPGVPGTQLRWCK